MRSLVFSGSAGSIETITIIIVLNTRLYKFNYSTSISGRTVASTTILILVVTGEILVNVDDVITSRNNWAIDLELLLHN